MKLNILILIYLPPAFPQSQQFLEKWGSWDSVSCFACGLATIDPEMDEVGTYGINPGTGKKMYNHSCDLLENGLKGNYDFAGQELSPRDWVEKIEKSEPVMVNGSQAEVCLNVTTLVPGVLDPETNTTSESTNVTETQCNPAWRNWTETVTKAPKTYDLEMWKRRCPRGVRSCFKAQGNWDDQKPVFRGCAGAKYEHGTKCKRELQRVEVVPGKPKVDVEVFLCYCDGDYCNKNEIIAGAPRPLIVPNFLAMSLFLSLFMLH